ncbi:Anaphase-promoting complex (APC) [Forsythia ovata]|uniref:Anaphase-promoting complex (APC) n=1 Tax=Forsythia ovata TaxID=205694 RepID=A0ABD1RMQ8_9LAMI
MVDAELTEPYAWRQKKKQEFYPVDAMSVEKEKYPVSVTAFGSDNIEQSVKIRNYMRRTTSILEGRRKSTVLEHDNQSIDGDGAARLVQLTSTRTTPSGSRRWRRVFSDTESDGFDSFYRENESYVSFRRYKHFPGEDDTIS